MMKTEILGVIAQIVLMVALSYPLGKYIAKVYKKEKTWLDFMKPVERLMFRLSGINPEEEMNWKQFLGWFFWSARGTCPSIRTATSDRRATRRSIHAFHSW